MFNNVHYVYCFVKLFNVNMYFLIKSTDVINKRCVHLLNLIYFKWNFTKYKLSFVKLYFRFWLFYLFFDRNWNAYLFFL